MKKILLFNEISEVGLEQFNQAEYEIGHNTEEPHAIIVRSQKLHDYDFPASVKAIGRAGAGVNNIPVQKMTELGIPVFNASGANANAVNELVIAATLLAYRNIPAAIDYVKNIDSDDDQEISKQVEKGKKQFVGNELAGCTLGVIGLGAIGVRVANAALGLGMQVVGFDPAMTLRRAWELSSDVIQATSVEEVCSRADVITMHVPLIDATRHMISAERIQSLRKDTVLLNFARQGIVDESAILKSLDDGKLKAYVTDFPNRTLIDHPKVIALPHLGASTEEAEINCAVMVSRYVKDYLENGNIRGSVNFPEVVMANNKGHRLCIANANVPNMVSQITTALADSDLNIVDLLNRSREDIAYTLVDVNAAIPQKTVDAIKAIEGVLVVNVLSEENEPLVAA